MSFRHNYRWTIPVTTVVVMALITPFAIRSFDDSHQSSATGEQPLATSTMNPSAKSMMSFLDQRYAEAGKEHIGQRISTIATTDQGINVYTNFQRVEVDVRLEGVMHLRSETPANVRDDGARRSANDRIKGPLHRPRLTPDDAEHRERTPIGRDQR